MKFKRLVRKDPNFSQVTIVSFLSVMFLFFAFFVFATGFNVLPGLNVNLPNVLTSKELNASSLNLVISGDDVISIQNKPADITQLKSLLAGNKYDSVLIRADKKTSLEVITKIWDVCKEAGIKKISIITTYN